MSANATDYDFDEYDKPGAERSRRRRGEDDNIESDLEEDLLEDDWLSCKKNPSEASDEELNDDLLQSDDEDVSGMDLSIRTTYNLSTPYDQQDNVEQANYTDDIVHLGAEGCDEGDVGDVGYLQEGDEEYTEGYSQGDITGMPEDQTHYPDGQVEGDDGYQDEVLDIQINEPIDGDFQDDEYQTAYDDQPMEEHGLQQKEVPVEEIRGEEKQEEEEEDTAESSLVIDTEKVKEERKEESDEDEEDEESGRMRFKSERKDGGVSRLADASKRRDIPETLELSEKAKRDLMQFEEQEREKRQIRHGGRGGGGGGGGGRRGRGRGGFSSFGMVDFRGGNRGRMNDQRLPVMGRLGKQLPSSRMPPYLHQQQGQSQQHHPLRPRGLPLFKDYEHSLAQPPLQPLLPLHMAHRSPPLRPQMEPPPRMMNSPPPNFPHHHQQQPPQSKNIHINPHFRGPASSSVQVPLMPPAQSQPRPAVSPQRFPGPGDFQQLISGNFGQPQRPPQHVEPFRSRPPPQVPQERKALFMGEHAESMRFPGQHMFDHQSPGPLMNSSHSLHHQQQLSDHSHMGFRPSFNQPGQGPLGLFPREPPRPNLTPHQGHQGIGCLNQQDNPPNQPRPFMGPRQSFGQQGNVFPPPHVQYRMPIRVPQHDPMPSHHPIHQHHRQELPPHHQQPLNVNEICPVMHLGQNSFHQQQTHGGSPRQITPHLQNLQQRNMPNRQRMNTPISKQMQQRNSNLRELPVAPANANMNIASHAADVRPVANAAQELHAGQSNQPMPGRGRGQVAAKNESQFMGDGRTVVRKEIPSTPSSTAQQNLDEDEETRQYRLKIEEQKRLREEILRRKEMRRQMQAGVRKKQLLDRLNSQSNAPGQSPALSQIRTSHPNQQMPNPVQQQQQFQPPQMWQQQQQEQGQLQQQRQFSQKTPQSLNQTFNYPNQGTSIPPNGSAPATTAHSNVRTRLQMVKGSIQQQQQQNPWPAPGQQWKQPQQNQPPQLLQQQKINAVQNINRPCVQIQSSQIPQKNIPVMTSMGPGQAQLQGPKPGAKRTVMQRGKSSDSEGQQMQQKVRIINLSGAGGNGPVASDIQEQQQGTWSTPPLNQAIQRKVTMAGQQQQGAGIGIPPAGRGAMGNPQQNRVVVSCRGRGGGQMGRGLPLSARPGQRGPESKGCTVSIEGLSSSTTDSQLRNLLQSVGPIEMFKMMPQQRRAIAKFSSAQHAANFQMSFHRSIPVIRRAEDSQTD